MNMKRVAPLAMALTTCGLATLAFAACDDRGPGSTPVASPSVGPSSAILPGPSAPPSASFGPDEHRHVGLAGLLLRTAYDQNLTGAERARLDAAEARLYPPNTPSPWTVARAFHADLVEGVRARKLDRARLTADYAAFDNAVAAGQDAEAAALGTLHGALSAGHRRALVDRVKAKLAARLAWTPQATDDAGVPARVPDWVARRVDRGSAAYALTATQKKAVAELLLKDSTMTPAAMQARHDAAQKQIDTLLEDFVKDAFDPKAEPLAPPVIKAPHDVLKSQATLAFGMLGILKGNQRGQLADALEALGTHARYVDSYDQGVPSMASWCELDAAGDAGAPAARP